MGVTVAANFDYVNSCVSTSKQLVSYKTAAAFYLGFVRGKKSKKENSSSQIHPQATYHYVTGNVTATCCPRATG